MRTAHLIECYETYNIKTIFKSKGLKNRDPLSKLANNPSFYFNSRISGVNTIRFCL
jgi:hypothetical protein